MKRIVITTVIMCLALGMQAQSNDGLNPFAKFGYTPKIATLSNGKYIESFDDDTIVQIGTVLYNTKRKQIVQLFVEEDTSEYRMPSPDLVSIWISPDQLFEERPEWMSRKVRLNVPKKQRLSYSGKKKRHRMIKKFL